MLKRGWSTERERWPEMEGWKGGKGCPLVRALETRRENALGKIENSKKNNYPVSSFFKSKLKSNRWGQSYKKLQWQRKSCWNGRHLGRQGNTASFPGQNQNVSNKNTKSKWLICMCLNKCQIYQTFTFRALSIIVYWMYPKDQYIAIIYLWLYVFNRWH